MAIGSVLGSVDGHIAAQQLDAGRALDLALGRHQHPAGVEALAGHGGHRQGGPLAQVLVVDLGDRAVELAERRGQALDDRALVLERRGVRQPEVQAEQGDEQGYLGISTIS